jgi:hypothetical protein
MKRTAIAASIACSFSVASLSTRAEEPEPPLRAEARALAERGDAQFEVGRCDKAIDLWREAEAKFHAPTILLRIARCQALLGKVVEATAALDAIDREVLEPDGPPPFAEAKRAAERELAGVRARIATLKITVDKANDLPSTPTIEVDDETLPSTGEGAAISVNPGRHLIRVRVAETLWERPLTVGDGEVKAYRISLSAEQPPPPQRIFRQTGLVIGGVGAASLAVGAGFGLSALATSRHLESICGAERRKCPQGEQGTINRLQSHALIADLTIAVGAAFVATSVLLWIAEPQLKLEPPRIRISASAWTLGSDRSTFRLPGAGLWIAGVF